MRERKLAANGKRDRKEEKNKKGEKKLKIPAIKNFRNTTTCSSHECFCLYIFRGYRLHLPIDERFMRKLYELYTNWANHSTYALDVKYAVSPSFRTAVF